jgi:hypothetical protein
LEKRTTGHDEVVMAIHFKNPKATFIHIPKTGGSSFEQWVYNNVSDYDRQDKHATYNQSKEIWNDLGTTFTFVRNPFARIVSMYHFIGQRAIERNQKRTQGLKVKKSTSLEGDTKIEELYNKGFNYWLTSLYNDTNEFIDTPNGDWSRKNPQTYWLENSADIIIKLEEINQKILILEELFNCKINLPHVNKSNHKHYSEYYNNSTKKIIEELFITDLETFGYEF